MSEPAVTGSTQAMPSGRRTLRSSVTDTVLQAVLEELAEVGYGKLTMDGVATRAGASKPTLYRRWPSKREMVLSAVATVSRATVPPDDGRGLYTHLLELARGVRDWLDEPIVRRVLPDLLAEGMRSNAMDAALTHHIAEPRRAAIGGVMEAAKLRGEVRADADIELALDMIGALIYWRLCVLRCPVKDDYLHEVARLIHRELSEHPSDPGR